MTQPYPSYTDTSVGWIGRIPQHWSVRPIRKVARLESGHTPSRTRPEWWQDCSIPWFSLADVWQIRDGRQKYVRDTKEKVSEIGLANSAARLLPRGTVILSRTASVGYSGIMGVDMATTQDFANWVCGASLEPEFLLFCLRGMSGEFERLRMGSTHNTIYMPDIQSLRIALPPLEEQRAIAAFLDRETGKIDALVEEQRRLIVLLKEKRQAVISHAVTKGLDPTAPLKPSGIDWLGDIPSHWDAVPLKRIAMIQTGIAKGKEYAGQEVIGVPYLRVANVQSGYLDLDDVSIIELPAPDVERYLLRNGDVLMNEGGDFDKLGRGHIWRGEISPCVHQNHVFAVRPQAVSPEWLGWSTCSDAARFYFMSRSKQSTNLASISSRNLMELPVPLPPDGERVGIVAFLERETAKLDALISEAETAIDLLQERRSALISAAVTGKIDVRDTIAATPGTTEAA